MSVPVSIVIPIYNVERWLHACIESIMNQPFQHFEMILVNDGSTDRCGQICDQYAARDSRIRAVHKPNGGLSSARNAGMDAATGTYVSFIDPDDKLEPEYYTKLLSLAERHRCDVVTCGYETVPAGERIVPGYELNRVMHGRDYVLSASRIHSDNDLCFVWRSLYRLDFIKQTGVRFNEQVFIGEDTIFNLELLPQAERVIAIQDSLYRYTVNNPDSLMKVPYKPRLESSLILQHKIRRQLSERYGLLAYDHYRRDMAFYYLNHVYRMMIVNVMNGPEEDKLQAIYRILDMEMFRQSLAEIGFAYSGAGLKEYIYFLAMKFKFRPFIQAVHKKELRLRQ